MKRLPTETETIAAEAELTARSLFARTLQTLDTALEDVQFGQRTPASLANALREIPRGEAAVLLANMARGRRQDRLLGTARGLQADTRLGNAFGMEVVDLLIDNLNCVRGQPCGRACIARWKVCRINAAGSQAAPSAQAPAAPAPVPGALRLPRLTPAAATPSTTRVAPSLSGRASSSTPAPTPAAPPVQQQAVPAPAPAPVVSPAPASTTRRASAPAVVPVPAYADPGVPTAFSAGDFTNVGILMSPGAVVDYNKHIRLTPADFKATLTNGVGFSGAIEFHGSGTGNATLRMHGKWSSTSTESTTLRRNFSFRTQTVEHAYFELPASDQDKGISKQVFSNLLSIYDRAGVEKIKVHANIDVGGYTWGRYGFVPDQNSTHGNQWSSIKRQVRPNLERLFGQRQIDQVVYDKVKDILARPDPHALFALCDMPEKVRVYAPDAKNAKVAQQLLTGTNWYGTAPIKGPEGKRFRDYISKSNATS